MESSQMTSGYQSSAVSTGNESSMSSQGTSNISGKPEDSKRKYVIIGGCALLLLALIVVIILYAGSSSSSSEEQSQGGEDEGSSGNKPAAYIRPTNAKSSEPTANTGSPTRVNVTAQNSTAERPIPPQPLVCTFGPKIQADTPFPEDGLCDYIFLEELAVDKTEDLLNYPANIQHFFDMAAKHETTQYGVGFDTKSRNKMMEILKEEQTKAHFETLLEKRILHFGYFNSPTYTMKVEMLQDVLNVLKGIVAIVEDKQTPNRPMYTFVASCWAQYYNEIAASTLTEMFKTIHMPDLFISKAHQIDNDSHMKECLMLPTTILARPDVENKVYFYDLFTALKYVGDVHDLNLEHSEPPVLSVSVGLSGRWYFFGAKLDAENNLVGQKCSPTPNPEQEQSPSSVCKDPIYSTVLDNEDFKCKYVLNKENSTAFIYDTKETLRYKLCASHKNVTNLHYGYTAANLEFDDGNGKCGQGDFPLLRAVKSTLEFIANEYTTETDFEKCTGSENLSLQTSEKQAGTESFEK